MRETAGKAAAPAARCKNRRRRSFIFFPPNLCDELNPPQLIRGGLPRFMRNLFRSPPYGLSRGPQRGGGVGVLQLVRGNRGDDALCFGPDLIREPTALGP